MSLLLARARLSTWKRLFSLYPITALQQLNLYSTKNTYTSQKTQQSTNPRTQKSSEAPSTFSQRIKKQTGSPTLWPKPTEIPYQAKVSNFVNLIGYIKSPVRFESTSDGKYFAAAVISQENIGEKSSLLVPVVFEGDLAHVVACHVKENDCVFVSGQLSVDPVGFSLGDSFGKFRVVVENLNFVEGLRRNVSGKKKTGVSFEFVKPEETTVEDVVEKVDNDEEFNQQWKNALELAKKKSFSNGTNDWPADVSSESSNVHADESKQEKDNEKSGESVNKKRDGEEFWRDLLKNPLQWWDYRGHKSNGLVKEKFPDFKHKETGDPLWVNSAPNWVLPGLDKLEFDVKFMKAKQVEGSERKNDGKGEDSWKNLVENPNKWWDNRLGKRHPKAPDFKHKETGEVLWVSNSPGWALSKLPPLNVGGKAQTL